jgi:hypothetical protein
MKKLGKKSMVEIHETYCSHCPSKGYPPDPEVEDILKWPKEERIKSVFDCAWRPGKLRKGYWERIQ